jgi:hypothetical protein
MDRLRLLAAAVFAATVAVLFVAHTARSDDAIRIRVTYSVAPGCPARAQFMQEIRARSSRVVEVTTGDDAIPVAVSVSREAGGFTGRVTTGSADARTTRTVAGTSCSEVIAGLALVAAVAVDPSVLSGRDAGRDAAGDESVDAGVDAATPVVVDAAPEAPRDASVVVVPPEASAPPITPPPSSSSSSWALSLGAGANLVAAPAPETLWSGVVFADVLRNSDGWSPSFRLSVERSFHENASPTTPGADFTWTAASLDGCPAAWLPHPLRVEACARVTVGVTDVTGANTTPTRNSTRIWASAGPVARVRWSIARLTLGVEGAAIVPFVRDRYFAEPNVDATIYRAPALGWSVGAGVGFAIW